VEEIRALFHGLDVELASGGNRWEVQQRVSQFDGFLQSLQQRLLVQLSEAVPQLLRGQRGVSGKKGGWREGKSARTSLMTSTSQACVQKESWTAVKYNRLSFIRREVIIM
jgi:hypothetical protein